jgi:flavin reductase (DIM6/NTAB) family NADH-FMN oxidoreductase RutF
MSSVSHTTIDPKTLPIPQLYNLMTTCVTPRPVAWVSTMNAAGVRNVAAFSYFNAMSTNPPILVFSVGVRRDGQVKDTLINLREVPEYVVHIGTGSQMGQVEITGMDFAPDVDEFAQARLTPVPSEVVRVPRIAEAVIAMECQLHELHALPAGSRNTLVIGQVLRFHVREDLLSPEYLVDVLKLDPIARLGRKDFGLLGRIEDGQARADAFRSANAPGMG